MDQVANFLQQYTGNAYVTALIILIVGWFVAKILSKGIARMLKFGNLDDKLASSLNQKKSSGQFSQGVEKISFWVIMLIVLISVLERLGIQSVTTPLNDLLSKILNFIPNLLVAGLLLAFAVIFSNLVKIFFKGIFTAVDLDKKVGLKPAEGLSLSNVIATSLSAFVFLFFFPACLKALQLENISVPIENLIQTILQSVPNILLAILIVTIAVFLGKFVQSILTNILKVAGFDQLPAKLGLSSSNSIQGKSPSEVVGYVVFVCIVVMLFTQAIEVLGFEFLTVAASALTVGIFKILGALVILLIGTVLSKMAANALGAQKMLGKVAKYAIMILAGTMALHRADLAPQITSTTFQILISALGVAIGIGGAIALGLGGKDAVKRVLDKKVQ